MRSRSRSNAQRNTHGWSALDWKTFLLVISISSRISISSYKSAVFWAGTYHSRGQIITGKHISDTRSMRWEIYYVHPQSDRILVYARRHRVARLLQCRSADRQTYIDRSGQNYREWRFSSRASRSTVALVLYSRVTYYSAESLSWYSRARPKHSWTPPSFQSLFMTDDSSPASPVSSAPAASAINWRASSCVGKQHHLTIKLYLT